MRSTYFLFLLLLPLTGLGCKKPSPTPTSTSTSTIPVVQEGSVQAQGVYRFMSSDSELPLSLTILKTTRSIHGYATYKKDGDTHVTLIQSYPLTTSTQVSIFTSQDTLIGKATIHWEQSTTTLALTWEQDQKTTQHHFSQVNLPLVMQPKFIEVYHRTEGSLDNRCSFIEAYPLMNDTVTSSKSINATIERLVSSMSSTTQVPALEQRASQYIGDCVGELTALEESFDDLPVTMGYVSEQYLFPTLITTTTLSLYLDQYSYTGGAHGNSYETALVVNSDTGKVLTLKDLFKPEGILPLIQKERTLILESDQGEGLYDEVKTAYQTSLAPNALTTEEALEQFGPDTNFYLTEDGITFFHGSYDIAPYAAGAFYNKILYKDIRTLIRPDGPLSPFLSR